MSIANARRAAHAVVRALSPDWPGCFAVNIRSSLNVVTIELLADDRLVERHEFPRPVRRGRRRVAVRKEQLALPGVAVGQRGDVASGTGEHERDGGAFVSRAGAAR